MRNVPKFAVIASGVRLHACKVPLSKTGRQGILSQQQLVCAVGIFDSRPDIIVGEESQRRLGQIRIHHDTIQLALVPAPKVHRRSFAITDGAVSTSTASPSVTD